MTFSNNRYVENFKLLQWKVAHVVQRVQLTSPHSVVCATRNGWPSLHFEDMWQHVYGDNAFPCTFHCLEVVASSYLMQRSGCQWWEDKHMRKTWNSPLPTSKFWHFSYPGMDFGPILDGGTLSSTGGWS